MASSSPKRLLLLVILLTLGLSACSQDLGPASTSTPSPTHTPVPTPTETPIPLAITVNGQGITLEEYNAELARYQAAQTALGKAVPPDAAAQTVLNDMVDQLLLAQGAEAQGYVLDEASLQARIDALAAQVGGLQALADWESAHGYTEAGFRSALSRQVAAAWMRDQVAASLPSTADQVHVKQILLYNADTAQGVWSQLQAGADFEALATQYDPVTQGELGWFPQGYLLEPAVEAAAFSLQPGQYSEVIQTGAGYHIILVVERDPARPLSPDARLALQIKALEDWLVQQRARSTIITP
jgi:peptidyl-prolyl cis-trans isomerase C